MFVIFSFEEKFENWQKFVSIYEHHTCVSWLVNWLQNKKNNREVLFIVISREYTLFIILCVVVLWSSLIISWVAYIVQYHPFIYYYIHLIEQGSSIVVARVVGLFVFVVFLPLLNKTTSIAFYVHVIFALFYFCLLLSSSVFSCTLCVLQLNPKDVVSTFP